jgi:hypothetical protein
MSKSNLKQQIDDLFADIWEEAYDEGYDDGLSDNGCCEYNDFSLNLKEMLLLTNICWLEQPNGGIVALTRNGPIFGDSKEEILKKLI